jgi:hypothetical protein
VVSKGFLTRAAVVSSVLLSLLGGTAHAAVVYEMLEAKPLNSGSGTLKMWRNSSNGCMHAEVVNAPAGTVATERDDGEIMTFATNPSGGSTSTRPASGQFGAIRGAMFSDGVITYTKYYSSISTAC